MVLAQDRAPLPPATSRGENFSAKPPAALFASDCTGAGCHKGPQGLARNAGPGGLGLAGFLREHYTNSRESAAALANYLSKIPAGPEPKEARTPRGGKPATAAAPSGLGGLFESPAASEGRPTPNDARKPGQAPAGQNAVGHTPPARASRAPVKPEVDPAAPAATSAAHHPVVEPTEPPSKPEESAAKPADAAATPPESSAEPAMSPAKPSPTARAQRGRQPAATAAAPLPPAVPEAAPAPPPPPPKEYDIFD
jgi:hypothetical protein